VQAQDLTTRPYRMKTATTMRQLENKAKF